MKCSNCRKSATTYVVVVFDNDQTDYWYDYFCDDHAAKTEANAKSDKTVVAYELRDLPEGMD